MEKLLKKLRVRSVLVLILSFLALTWQFLSYMVLKTHLPEIDEVSNFEILMIYTSYIVYFILFLSILFQVYSAFRVNMKYKSIKKKEDAEKAERLNNSQELPSSEEYR